MDTRTDRGSEAGQTISRLYQSCGVTTTIIRGSENTTSREISSTEEETGIVVNLRTVTYLEFQCTYKFRTKHISGTRNGMLLTTVSSIYNILPLRDLEATLCCMGKAPRSRVVSEKLLVRPFRAIVGVHGSWIFPITLL